MSATGALLLLAAAATFLAVSWDSLGLTARVAAVGAGTAGAIVGGARLRRTLPAVGAVVFHLGALLLPVDALGLALQLDVDPAGTWVAVGATAVLTLPVAAHVGRSRVLAVAALAGVPVVATGLGLGGLAPAPLLTALVAGVALGAVRAGRDDASSPAAVLGLAAPTLAVAAVAGPLLVAVGAAVAVAGGGSPLRAAASAGWVPATWTEPVLAGVVAVLVVTATAVLRRSARWSGAVPVLVALVAVTTLLPGDAPRLARLLPWPLLFLAVEGVAVAARRDRVLGSALARTAVAAEVLAALAVPGALWTIATATRSGFDVIVSPDTVGPLVADPVLGAVALVTAAGWCVAAVRRRSLTAPTIAAAAATTALLGAAVTLLVPASGGGVLVALAGVLLTTGVRGGGQRGVAATATATVLAVPVLAGTWSVALVPARPTAVVGPVLLAVAAATVAGVLTARVVRHAEVGEGRTAAAALVPLVLVVTALAGLAVTDGSGPSTGLLAGVALLLLCGAGAAREPFASDALQGAAAATALLATAGETTSLGAAVATAPAAALAAAVLAAESVRRARPWLLVAAGPVLVRAVAGVGFAASGSRTVTGAVLLVTAVTAALVAVVAPRWRVAGSVAAVAAGTPAIVLLSLTPTAIAWATVAVGVTVVAAGLLTRQVPVAHVGGVVTTLGVWQLLAIAEVAAVDAWLAAPALQLWLVGWPARRAGRVSSWVADLPPFALVVAPALLERLAGGGGWHAALAGGLALVAVVGGGVGRHAGPLVGGVVAVVALVAIETLAVVADVPTWIWLTAGGVVLLGVGALIERTGGRPVATVRRLADVVAERFD